MSEPASSHDTTLPRPRPVSRIRAPRRWRVMTGDQPVSAATAALIQRHPRAARTNVGLPGSTYYFDLLTYLLGHHVLGIYPWGSKRPEREDLTIIGDLLRAPTDDRWGHVTSGGSEPNLALFHRARERSPNAVVYLSAAAHHGIQTCASIVAVPTRVIGTIDTGEMAYEDPAAQLVRHRHRHGPATATMIIIAIGTTMATA